MPDDPTILIIDSDSAVAARLRRKTAAAGFILCSEAKPTLSVQELKLRKPDIVILGPSLIPNTSMKCIHKVKIIDPAMPILVSSRNVPFLTPEGEPFEGIHPIQYEKDDEAYAGAIHSAVRHRERYKSRVDYPVIIGQSDPVRAIKQKIQRISSRDVTVLVTGETGTGKELIARSVHFHSRRSGGPLVKISCGALPDELLESEMFGFQKGAFTGAHTKKTGRLELAHEGTLFVDEIGDLSLRLQAKFLQVLEEKAFSRLGGIHDWAVDTRVVAATNSDLQKKVREGSFRQDLFYRLNVIHIKAPPLRERKDDIPLLMHYFLTKYCLDLRKELMDVPARVAEHFNAYRWPGNIRELENAVRRALALGDWSFAFREMILEEDPGPGNQPPVPEEAAPFPLWEGEEIQKRIREKDFSLKEMSRAYVMEAEKKAILDALAKTRWNRKRAAEILGVSYKTLLTRIADFSLKP